MYDDALSLQDKIPFVFPEKIAVNLEEKKNKPMRFHSFVNQKTIGNRDGFMSFYHVLTFYELVSVPFFE